MFSRRAFRILGVLAMAGACGDGTGTKGIDKEPRGIELSPRELTLNIGESAPVKVDVFNAAGKSLDIEEAKPEFSSDNVAVAAVDAVGMVTANGPGTARITATAGKAVSPDPVAVTVRNSIPRSVDVEPATLEVKIGQMSQLVATVKNSAGEVLKGVAVDWLSKNRTIADVDATGKATAMSYGKTTVEAIYRGTNIVSPPVQVSVLSNIAKIDITPVPIPVLKPGDPAKTLTATAKASDGTELKKKITWSTKDEKPILCKTGEHVLSITNDGKLTAICAGTATVVAEAEGVTGSESVTVIDITPHSIAINPPAAVLDPGGRVKLVPTVKNKAGEIIKDAKLNWSSTDAAVAIVGPGGDVEGKVYGKTTIKATATGVDGNPVEASVLVSVNTLVAQVVLKPAAFPKLKLGAYEVDAFAYDKANAPLPNLVATWTVTDLTVETVPPVARVPMSGSGIRAGGNPWATLTAMNPGTARLKAEIQGVTATADIEVLDLVPHSAVIDDFVTDPYPIRIDEKMTLKATVYNKKKETLSGVAVTWKSSSAAATVNAITGELKGLDLGTAVITVTTANAVFGKGNVDVRTNVASVTINEAPLPTMIMTDTKNLTVTIKDFAGKTIPNGAKTVIWSVKNTTAGTAPVASVSAGGTLTALAEGKAEIVASVDGVKSVPAGLEVMDNVPDHIQIDGFAVPKRVTLRKSGFSTLTAKVYNKSKYLLKNETVTWKSFDKTVVTVLEQGRTGDPNTTDLTAVGVGIASIIARDGGVSVTVPVTVVTDVDKIVILPQPLPPLTPGKTTQVSADVFSFTGKLIPSAVVTWRSSKPASVTVTSTGPLDAELKGLSAGNAEIFAENSGVVGKANAGVYDPVVVTSVSPLYGRAGTQVTINGTGLLQGHGAQDRVLEFGTTQAKPSDIVDWFDNFIVVKTPSTLAPGAHPIKVTLVNAGLSSNVSQFFTVTNGMRYFRLTLIANYENKDIYQIGELKLWDAVANNWAAINMTSATSPAPRVVTWTPNRWQVGEQYRGNFDKGHGWKSFDGKDGTQGDVAECYVTDVPNSVLKLDLGPTLRLSVSKYALCSNGYRDIFSYGLPKIWKLEASDDGVLWHLIHDRPSGNAVPLGTCEEFKVVLEL